MSEPTYASDRLWFCRQVRARSREHKEAMNVASQEGWLSIVMSILRQELDSMVRVIFLLSLSEPAERQRLLSSAVSGRDWELPTPKGKLRKVTDREMVERAQGFHGWVRNVYLFGCSFIHLSDRHDYLARDPFRALPLAERDWIAQYLRLYHGGEASSDSTFREISAYAPRVLSKISSNLELYLVRLENEGNFGTASPNDMLDGI